MSTLMRSLILCLFAVLYGTSAFAGSDYKPITSEEFNIFLPGETITGEYRRMREGSQTYRFQETHNKDGTTLYKEGPIKSKGLWYTLGKHKICYRYPNDKDLLGTSCFWVYKSDTCYYGYDIYEMSLKGPRDFANWSARWVVKGDGGTCNIPTS